jgi:hypothetical protein
MKLYADLEFKGSPEAVSLFLNSLGEVLPGGWTRNHPVEEQMAAGPVGETRCYACSETPDRRGATVFIARKKDGNLHVLNVVPATQGKLTNDMYNTLLQDLLQSGLRQAAESAGLTVRLGRTAAGIQDFVSPAAFTCLAGATGFAKTAAMHPTEQTQWHQFLVLAHQEDSSLDSGFLHRWLLEEQGWDDDEADDLAGQYELGRELLAVQQQMAQ